MSTLATAVISCGDKGSEESIGFKRRMEIRPDQFKIGEQYVIQLTPEQPCTVLAFNYIAPDLDSNHPDGVYFFTSTDPQVFDALISHSGGSDDAWQPA